MHKLINKTIAVDLCNTIADVNSELDTRLGHNPEPKVYFHPGLNDKPKFFEANLDIYLKAKPIGNSQQILNYLAMLNTIVYITARPKISEFVTRLWLKTNGFPKAPIYFTTDKVDIASKLNVDIAIDDAPHEIVNYKKAGFVVFVKSQPYNQEFDYVFEWDSNLDEVAEK